MWALKNSVRLKSQIGLRLLKTWMIVWTSVGLGTLIKHIATKTKYCARYYLLKQKKYGLTKSVQNDYINENLLN